MPLKRPEKSVTLKSPLPPTSQIRGLSDVANLPMKCHLCAAGSGSKGPIQLTSGWQSKETNLVKLPAINPKYPSRMLNVSTNKEFSGKNKLSFPPVPTQRKSRAVNFSKLISNDYGTDWFLQCTGWEKKIQEASENSKKSKDSEPSQSESAPSSNESKPLFHRCNK